MYLFQNNERWNQKHLNYSIDKFEKVTHFVMFCLHRSGNCVGKGRCQMCSKREEETNPRFLGSPVVVECSGNLYSKILDTSKDNKVNCNNLAKYKGIIQF